MKIRLFKPSFDKNELNAVKKVLNNSWVGMGKELNNFEDKWKNYLGCRDAFALNSGTAALHLALKTLKLKKNKKVLVPSLTFAASATCIIYNQLKPVFVDSNDRYSMCFEDLKKKYTTDCVAIIIVHYAGHPAELEKIIPWAKKNKLKIIEDCAHSDGSYYRGKRLGLWGDIGCFSFEEKKIITTGDGGMICSNKKNILKNIRAERWVGIDKDNWKSSAKYLKKNKDAYHWFYEINQLGYKYNMNDLSASIGIEQLKKITFFRKKREIIISKYLNGIKNLKTIKTIFDYKPKQYCYWLFAISCKRRDDLVIFLKSKGISTGCHYTPLTEQPLFKKYNYKCEKSVKLINSTVSLPLHVDLTIKEVDYIIFQLKKFEKYYY